MTRARWIGALNAAGCAAAAVIAAAVAQANVQVGSSGWQWGNPLPQGNTLRALSFAGTRGYAAGDFGTLLRTDDGGATWTGLPAGTFQSLSLVQAVDADTVIAGGGCVARRSDDGGQTFTRIAFTPIESRCNEGLAALFFTTKRSGYIARTDGTVQQTADGGDSFAQKTAIPGTRAAGGTALPTDLLFLSDATGFAATSEGKIFRTLDGGTSWNQVHASDRAVRDVVFVDTLDGFAVGNGGLFLSTTDGGTTWTPRATGSQMDLTQVRCATPQLCVVATAPGTQLLRTSDGGQTFAILTPSTAPIFTAAFATPTRVVAGGESGATVVSADAGLTFSPVGGALSGAFRRVIAGAVPGSAFATGNDGALARTTDGGKSWTRGSVSTSEDVLDVAFPTLTDGFALDVSGGLFRTSDGGGHWKTLDPGTTAPAQALLAVDKNTVLLIGGRGIRRSTDGGGTFAGVKGISRVPLGRVDRAGKAIIAFGSQDLLLSTDAGRTWHALRKPGTYKRVRGKLVNRLRIVDADFLNAKTGYLRDPSRLWKTRNGGRSWQELPGIGANNVYGLAFSSTKSGYVATSSFGDTGGLGFVMRTTDGGATWHPQLAAAAPIAPQGIAAPVGGTDYLLAGGSSLLFTTTGGDAGKPSTLTITTKRRKLTKPAHITVTGKLASATGNERVTVSYRQPGTLLWRHQTVSTAANGAFTTSWNVRKGVNLFVAQWAGDFRSTGDGSPVLQVRVAR
jgi:photosystem II stability/assembly factor-like uncharacterized protein